MYMKKHFRCLSLIMTTILILIFTCSCSGNTPLTATDILNMGKETFTVKPDTTRTFTVNITHENGHQYNLTGNVADGRTVYSLEVLYKGLRSNYKNIAVTADTNLYLGMNSFMTAAEDQLGFMFHESASLQNQYLCINGGADKIADTLASYQSLLFDDITVLRANTTPSNDGSLYTYNYDKNSIVATLDKAIEKVTNDKTNLIAKCDSNINAMVGDNEDVLTSILQYSQGCVNIDTKAVISEHQSIGTKIFTLVYDDLNALKNNMNTDNASAIEHILWDEDTQAFTHKLSFMQGDKVIRQIRINSSIPDNAYQFKENIASPIDVSTFLENVLLNAKYSAGVGYESSDFPYEVEYTTDTITLKENNTLYTAVHTFTFENGKFQKYSIDFSTFELYMHKALANKYHNLQYEITVNELGGLSDESSAGRITCSTYSLASKYDTKDVVALVNSIYKLGVPSYDTNNNHPNILR